eukprot:3823824-Amphidinium_carterae.1
MDCCSNRVAWLRLGLVWLWRTLVTGMQQHKLACCLGHPQGQEPGGAARADDAVANIPGDWGGCHGADTKHCHHGDTMMKANILTSKICSLCA